MCEENESKIQDVRRQERIVWVYGLWLAAEAAYELHSAGRRSMEGCRSGLEQAVVVHEHLVEKLRSLGAFTNGLEPPGCVWGYIDDGGVVIEGEPYGLGDIFDELQALMLLDDGIETNRRLAYVMIRMGKALDEVKDQHEAESFVGTH